MMASKCLIFSLCKYLWIKLYEWWCFLNMMVSGSGVYNTSTSYTSRRFGSITHYVLYVIHLNIIIVKFISTLKKIMVPHAISSLFYMLLQQFIKEILCSHTTNNEKEITNNSIVFHFRLEIT